MPGAAALWWAGGGSRAPRLARASRDALEAWIVAQAGTQVLKYSCGRARPWLEEGDASFAGPAIDDARHSFPSGHVSNSWAVLGAYAAEYRDVPAVSVPLWTLAAGVAASRVHDDEHWLSDVVSGALIGLVAVRAVRAWNATPSSTSLVALPTADGWVATLTVALPARATR